MLPSISLLQLLFWFLFSMPHMRTAMVSLQCTYYIYIATHPAWMTVQEAGSSGEPDLSLAKATDIYRANETTSSQIKQFSTCSHSPKKASKELTAENNSALGVESDIYQRPCRATSLVSYISMGGKTTLHDVPVHL